MRVFLQLFIAILLCLFLQFVLLGQTVTAKSAPTPSAERYILMDETTGRVLLEKMHMNAYLLRVSQNS